MSQIESNDNNLPQIERAVKGKKSGRANMKTPPHIRLKDQSEGTDQALESLAAWRLEREKALEERLKELDAMLGK